MKFNKDHPYMIKLDEVLKKEYTVLKTSKVTDLDHSNIIVFSHEEQEKDYEEMKQTILDTLFTNYLGNTIRK
jgi:hypothetical protein